MLQKAPPPPATGTAQCGAEAVAGCVRTEFLDYHPERDRRHVAAIFAAVRPHPRRLLRELRQRGNGTGRASVAPSGHFRRKTRKPDDGQRYSIPPPKALHEPRSNRET